VCCPAPVGLPFRSTPLCPFFLHSLGHLGCEYDVYRTIRILFLIGAQAADPGKLLIDLQHTARLRIVDGHRFILSHYAITPRLHAFRYFTNTTSLGFQLFSL
jgi:hypothetical protein